MERKIAAFLVRCSTDQQDYKRQIEDLGALAEDMGFSKPSVSRALSILKEENCISVDEKGFIILTRKGSQIAKKIYERHVVLSDMLIALGVDKKTALEDACRVEHVISDKSFAAIKKFIAENKKE